MLVVIDRHSGIPAYRQLMDQIKFHVASGLLTPGDELPSTRVLSAQIGLNPMTVSKAYNLLERDGVVERRPGLSLIVKPAEEEELHSERMEQLRNRLAPTVTMIRQLGIAPVNALEVFAEMLNRRLDSNSEEEV